MKTQPPLSSFTTICKTARKIICLGALTGMGATTVSAATVYWDQNTAVAGFQTTASTGGNWTTSAFWTADSLGTTGPWATAVSGSDFVFTSGAGNTANTVALNNSITANSITFSNGRWAFTGTSTPTITVGAGGVTFNNAAGISAGGATSFNNGIAFVLGASQTWTNNAINNSNNITVAGSLSGSATTGNTTVLTLTGATPGSGTQISAVITDGGNGGNLSIVVNNPVLATTATDSSYQITGNANTYSGKTVVQSGMLRFSSITDIFGGGSSLGNVTDVNLGTIDLGGTAAGGLIYNSTVASSSDRIINLAGTTAAGGGVIKNASTGVTSTLTLTGGVSNTGAAGATKTLTLGGTNIGNNSIAGIIADGTGANLTAVSKIDAGLWGLNANNIYSGGTTVTAGTLSLGAAGTLGANVIGNNVIINGGNLLLNADTNVGANQTISISSGGIGVSYLPTTFPTIIDNTGTNGGVFGLNYVGTGGIGSVTSISNLFGASSYWFLGAFTGGSGTYTGSSLAAGNGGNYRLGGGGGALTVQNNILTGANNLIIGGTGGGSVTLSNGNTYTGSTTVQSGTVNVSVLGMVGSTSSSIGGGQNATTGAISLGSGANAVGFNYTGAGETTDRQLKFVGTTGAVTLGNSGTGNVVYSAAPSITGSGAKTIILGNATDAFGGSIGAITDVGATKTSLTKTGLTNSRWVLTGGAGNTYTGNTAINGGVLETAAVNDLATSYITFGGDATNNREAILQTQGTISRTLNATANAANLNWGAGSGFAAKGGSLTLNFNAGAALQWGTAGFMGTGTAPVVFGSSTADNVVELKNSFDFGQAAGGLSGGFDRVIAVEGAGTVVGGTANYGVSGSRALISGVITANYAYNGTVGDAGNNGFKKTGSGTLILNQANTYSGATTIVAGTVIAGTNALLGVAGAFGDGHSTTNSTTLAVINGTQVINMGNANINGADGTAATGASPTLLIGGGYTVALPVNVANIVTTGKYGIGGSTDNNATFSGLVTISQNLQVTQVATTGANALNITAGITGGATAATKTVSFNNSGRVIVATVGITDGAGGGKIAVSQIGAGITNLAAANTYTGATTITSGTLLVNGTLAAGSAVALNGGKLGGAGTINGLVTSAGTIAHIAPGNSPGTLTLNGGLNAAAGLTFDFELGTASDLINTTSFVGSTAANGLVFNFTDAGGLAISTPYTLLNFSSMTGLDITDLMASSTPAGFVLDTTFGTGGWMINANNLQVQFAAVPEPSTYALLIGGIAFLFVLRKKQKKTV